MRDARGKTIQKESTLFFHDSELEQKKRFAEIEGNLAMRGGAGIAANTTVELVDKDGRVVQTVRSTAQGNYRFKSVAAGSYRVRATKEGWAAQEADGRSGARGRAGKGEHGVLNVTLKRAQGACARVGAARTVIIGAGSQARSHDRVR